MRVSLLVAALCLGASVCASAVSASAAGVRRFNPIHHGVQRYRAHQAMRQEQGIADEYAIGGDYSYQTYWTNYTLDHFNFYSSTEENENIFPARYLMNEDSFQKPAPGNPACGPIFFCQTCRQRECDALLFAYRC